MSTSQTQADAALRGTRSHLIPVADRLSNTPYWLVAALLLAVIAFWTILTSQDYRIIFEAVLAGVWTTIYVSIVSYALALLLGLVWMLMRVSHSRLLQEIASFFVEIIRGIPMLVLLYFIFFAGVPVVVEFINWAGQPLIKAGVLAEIAARDISYTVRAILALSIGYSAFISEIFRAGIQSIEKEQTESAQTEGAGYWQTMRFILLPQAVRNIFPALGNEFIAMLKDSALVSVLGVPDITQLGKVYAASTFRFLGIYSIVALMYLMMTLGLALLVRWIEGRLVLK